MVWYSHLFQNFSQFIVIHTVKGFSIAKKAEIDVFLELSCFFDPADVGKIWSLVPLPFLKSAWSQEPRIVLSLGRSVPWSSFYRNEVQKESGNSYRVAQPLLAEPRFKSSPRESKVHELDARPRNIQLSTMPSPEPRWPHLDWSYWNISISPNKENIMDHKKFNGRYHIWRFTAQYYINN